MFSPRSYILTFLIAFLSFSGAWGSNCLVDLLEEDTTECACEEKLEEDKEGKKRLGLDLDHDPGLVPDYNFHFFNHRFASTDQSLPSQWKHSQRLYLLYSRLVFYH
jgi:hypothetical protein